MWLLPGISSEAVGLEVAAKLVLPFFLVSGGIAAWVAGRVFRGEGDDRMTRGYRPDSSESHGSAWAHLTRPGPTALFDRSRPVSAEWI